MCRAASHGTELLRTHRGRAIRQDLQPLPRSGHQYPTQRQARPVFDPGDLMLRPSLEDGDELAALAAEVLLDHHCHRQIRREVPQHRGQCVRPPADVTSATTRTPVSPLHLLLIVRGPAPGSE